MIRAKDTRSRGGLGKLRMCVEVSEGTVDTGGIYREATVGRSYSESDIWAKTWRKWGKVSQQTSEEKAFEVERVTSTKAQGKSLFGTFKQ